MYSWAEESSFTTPVVKYQETRSYVVATIDFSDEVNASVISKVLRENQIVDTEHYRKLGRNQLRVAMFRAIDPDDIAVICGAINYIVGQLLLY